MAARRRPVPSYDDLHTLDLDGGMMRVLELTNYNTGNLMAFNTQQIVSITSIANITYINTVSGVSYTVKESYAEVTTALMRRFSND